MTPTINTCEELASDRDRELANTAWKTFRERVDALFDEQLRTTCRNHTVELLLVKRYAELLELGFDDEDGAETARSEYETATKDAIALDEHEAAYRFA